ncbi:MAG: orotidine-5'-phosphate decarboxylase [Bacteroidales bacterium]
MNYIELAIEIVKKESFLCIGLDSAYDKIPACLDKHDDPVFEFNRQIIDSTHDLVVAYKLNLAFYESQGAKGWTSLAKTVEYLKKYPEILVIADAKRGDIGNTAAAYAKAFFDNLKFDGITLAPYMGKDSVEPFLDYKDKWAVILAITSNEGANDFQFNYITDTQEYLYEQIIRKSSGWGSEKNIMYVVGATQAEHLSRVRKLVPKHFLLIPGVGAQGGSLKEVARLGMNKSCGLLVNSSRAIIFAGKDENFASLAREKAMEIKLEMKELLKQYL